MSSRRILSLMVLCLFVVAGLAPTFSQAESGRFPFSLGVVLSPPGEHPMARVPEAAGVRSLPGAVDLSADLPPVDSQGTQSSCVAWSVGYYCKSFQERKERGWDLIDLHHRFSPAFIYNQRATSDCDDDSGMSIPNAMTILVEQGDLPLADFPYDSKDSCTQPTAEQSSLAEQYRAESYAAVFIGQGWADLTVLKQHLAAGDPLVIAVPVYSSFLTTCSDLVVEIPAVGQTWYGAHAVLLVGYDDTVGGFKFVNSWGTSYGCGGFAYLSYEFVQQYAYEAWKMYDQVAPSNDPPSVGSINPASGTSDPGESVLFTTTYSDPDGWEDIASACFEIGDGVPANSVLLRYSAEDNRIWLRDESDTQWLGGHEPGSATTIENGLVSIDLASSIVAGVDSTLSVGWAIRFTNAYLGSHATYLNAEDLAGVSSDWSEVGQWSVGQRAAIELAQGWNLISLPVVPSSTSVAEVLSSIEGYYDAVQSYAGQEAQGQWSSYSTGVPEFANTLEQVDETMGLWISVTEHVTLSLLGSRPKGPEIPLYAGWNMVGYPLGEPLSVPEALASIGGQLSLVRCYDPTDEQDQWKHYDPSAPAWSNDLQQMQPGRGYWIRVNGDCTWLTGGG